MRFQIFDESLYLLVLACRFGAISLPLFQYNIYGSVRPFGLIWLDALDSE